VALLAHKDRSDWKARVARAVTTGLVAPFALVFAAGAAIAQGLPPPPGAPGQSPQYQVQQYRSAACTRLEGQLSAIDRGAGDANADQVRRYEEAANRQQQELDRLNAQARRAGCGGGGFFLFGGGEPAQCDRINRQIQDMRGNLERILSGLRQLQGGSGGRDEQRRAILVALAQNNCGPQYRSAERPRGFFESLFGGGSGPTLATPESVAPAQPSSTYRTVCVRTCDGFFFPISFSTGPERFQDDERTCQNMCPAAEAKLFSYRNPGEDISQAVSVHGQPYTSLANAFRYRQEFNASCTCKREGESWSEAVSHDQTLQQGDIVVTEDRAKALSLPKSAQPAQSQERGRGRTAAPPPRQPQTARAPQKQAEQPPAAGRPPQAGGNGGGNAGTAASPPRAVGPQFYR